MDQFNQSGNENFNDVPDWYTNSVEPVAPAPASAPAAAAPVKRRRAAKSPIASATDPRFNPNAPGGHQPVYNPVAQGVPHGGTSSGGGGVGRFIGGAVAKFGILAVFLGGGALLTLGTTSAEDLVQGDCFVMADELEIDRVDTTDCNDTHDSQVLGSVTLAGPAAYPTQADPYWEGVFAQCDNIAATALTNIDNLPFDTQLELFTPLENSWNAGDRESICIIHSPTGLSGSFIVGTE